MARQASRAFVRSQLPSIRYLGNANVAKSTRNSKHTFTRASHGSVPKLNDTGTTAIEIKMSNKYWYKYKQIH